MLRWQTAGESHGEALVAMIEGLPAGVRVTSDDVVDALARRRLGYGRGARMKFEQDKVRLLTGVRFGETLGSPVAIEIANTEWPKWTEVMSADPLDHDLPREGRNAPLSRPRPGHADLTGMRKYGFDDARPVLERSSARETASRVALGAVAARFLEQAFGIRTVSHVISIGGAGVEDADDAALPTPDDVEALDASPVRTLDKAAEERMIARIDESGNSSVGSRQLIWLCIALTLCGILVAVMRDYRVLRKYSYVNMVIGLILLLSPMIPGLGRNINGAKIWIRIGGYSLQPAEFAKLFLAFFFAAYLFDHRDQLAVGGKKVLGLQLPRIKDLGPIIMVWLISMGVLIMQRDLGTSLMFFAMFVAMLYAATGRRSWIVIGFIAFAVGAVAAASVFSHVGQRVDSWLHPFSDEQYNRIGGSWQLVTGIFGMASGGMTGTGLGHGQPGLTTFANSDFIYSSVGEELGLTGLMAVLVLYLLIIASGFITAMKIKDGFGKLLASGLVFTMAFQVFTVVGGITLVIPLTGMTMPYMAAGGSSLIANYLLAALLMIISNAANRPEPDTLSDTFQYEALAVLRDRELKERTDKESAPEREPQAERPPEPRHAAANNQTTEIIEAGAR